MTRDSLLVIFGIVLIVEGIPWFLSPQGARRVLFQLFSMGDRSLRGMGLAFMLIGLLFVYLARG